MYLNAYEPRIIVLYNTFEVCTFAACVHIFPIFVNSNCAHFSSGKEIPGKVRRMGSGAAPLFTQQNHETKIESV